MKAQTRAAMIFVLSFAYVAYLFSPWGLRNFLFTAAAGRVDKY